MLGGPPYAVAMTFPPPVCIQHADPSQAACLSLVLAATLRGCPLSGLRWLSCHAAATTCCASRTILACEKIFGYCHMCGTQAIEVVTNIRLSQHNLRSYV